VQTFGYLEPYVGYGHRVTLHLGAANRDPSVWGADADKFRLRPLETYEAHFVGFAEGAIHTHEGSPFSRTCVYARPPARTSLDPWPRAAALTLTLTRTLTLSLTLLGSCPAKWLCIKMMVEWLSSFIICTVGGYYDEHYAAERTAKLKAQAAVQLTISLSLTLTLT
jgi:hypothetical protein